MENGPRGQLPHFREAEDVMNRQHFAGFLATLLVTAAQFYALEAGSVTTWAARANPAVVDDSDGGSRLVGPTAARHAADQRNG
jgi:hypothetical protein